MKIYNGRVPACGVFCGGCPTYTRQKNPCLGAVTAAVFIYGILILRTGTIQKEEMRRIPAGRKFVSFCEKIKLW